jgi:ADP-ribosylglycohydrolase
MSSRVDFRSRVRGCLLGGAVGDALGAPVEFMSGAAIAKRFGEEGVRTYTEAGGKGRITDDTQMTLFTAEGMIRARVRAISKGICHEASVIDHAYARWLTTQGGESRRWKEYEDDGWLIEREELHVRRAPGNTCLKAMGGDKAGTMDEPTNDSKGCGGVMRMAPVGLFPGMDAEARFLLGAEAAVLTHGHPSGYLSAGFLAVVIGALIDGVDKFTAVAEAERALIAYPDNTEVKSFVESAVERAEAGLPGPGDVEKFGGGWVAEEALAIALWAFLATDDFSDGVAAAVSHAGDSDSTGAIAGNLFGAAHGIDSVPAELIANLAEREIVERIADDVTELLDERVPAVTEEIFERYPGW